MGKSRARKAGRNSGFRKIAVTTLALLAAFYAWIIGSLIIFRFFNPPTTAVQIERRIESWFSDGKYTKQQEYVTLRRISLVLQHAVISAEDGRFYHHHGLDFTEIQDAIEDDFEERGRLRGASTITQQVMKNLFFSTRGSALRKAAEFATVPLAELILGKQRILELYLNVIEWGPGVYGAEAAAKYHYWTNAARIGRDQAARLAAVIPSPRRRKPQRMDRYAGIILARMSQHGW